MTTLTDNQRKKLEILRLHPKRATGYGCLINGLRNIRTLTGYSLGAAIDHAFARLPDHIRSKADMPNYWPLRVIEANPDGGQIADTFLVHAQSKDAAKAVIELLNPRQIIDIQVEELPEEEDMYDERTIDPRDFPRRLYNLLCATVDLANMCPANLSEDFQRVVQTVIREANVLRKETDNISFE